MFGLGDNKLRKRIRELEIENEDYLSTAIAYKRAHANLNNKWNDLVDKVNAKGGQGFLEDGIIPNNNHQFTQDEIKKLILLCHPDKHDGKPMAKELTDKLLKLRI